MERTCFFITPIGGPNTPERQRADNVLEFILAPALGDLCEIVRADKIAEPGSITSQIFQNLIDSLLAVADLHGFNPNVMYELGVRHSFNKPTIILLDPSQKIPFDVSQERAIVFDITDVRQIEIAKASIRTFADRVLKGIEYKSPVVWGVGVPAELQETSLKVLSKLAESVSDLESQVSMLENSVDMLSISDTEGELEKINEKLMLLFKLVNQRITSSNV